MRTRAWRRAQRKRVKNNFREKVSAMKYWETDESCVDWYVTKYYNTRKPCSCHMCGNPRRIWKSKTIHEKKFDEIERDSLIGE